MNKTQTEKSYAPHEINPQDFQVIGIGASAGGLEVLKEFFDHLPRECPHSFVVIQHLSPDYKSLMAELLAKNTDIPVKEAGDDEEVLPRTIYLIPPKKNMTISDNRLWLSDKPLGFDAAHLPIDIFFRSLAADKKDRAVGVILSGSGSDGTQGVRTIKEAGGMVMVQNPEEAKFDGMPKSAISTGLADTILPIQDLASEMLNLIQLPKSEDGAEKQLLNDENSLDKILTHICNVSSLDFSSYKRPTLIRRISRRMGMVGKSTPKEYLAYVYQHSNEVDLLVNEFLIGVTRFFRDEAVWSYFKDEIVPNLIKGAKSSGESIKIWSVGCSTGEEAYTLAMIIREELDTLGLQIDVKIFATDLQKLHLDVARKGVYPLSTVADIPKSYIKKYFRGQGDTFNIAENIRKMVIFSEHNILKDPPFNKMDLVVCRNMLIYLQTAAQNKAIGLMHFALKLNGYLLLGSSETVGELKDVFAEVDRKFRIYVNKEASRQLTSDKLPYHNINRSINQRTAAGDKNLTVEKKMTESFNSIISRKLDIAGVYLDENYNIIHAIGKFRHFIEFPEEGFSTNVLKMLPNQLSMAVSSASRKALRDNQEVAYLKIRYTHKDQVLTVDVYASPFEVPNITSRKLVLVTFIPQTTVQELSTSDDETHYVMGDQHRTQKLSELEEELARTKEDLQNTIEQVETSNEELQSTNEELLAANEELQGTNEELQSVNEELHTVNSEHELKLEEVGALKAEIDNILKSTEIGIIFLDTDNRIKKITPSIREQFNLQENDIGRPITHFTSNFVDNEVISITDEVKVVSETHKVRQAEVKTNDGQWYLQRILPFVDSDGKKDGVVITYINVTESKEMDSKYENLEKLLDVTRDALITVDLDGTILGWNETAKDIYKFLPAEIIGKPISTIYSEESEKVMREMFKNLANNGANQSYRTRHSNAETENIEVLIKPTILFNKDNQISAYSLSIKDLTEENTLRQSLAEQKQQYKALYESSPDMLLSVGTNGLITNVNQKLFTRLGYKNKDEVVGMQVFDIYAETSRAIAKKCFERFMRNEKVHNEELTVLTKEGYPVPVLLSVEPVLDENGEISHSNSVWREVSSLSTQQGAESLLEKAFKTVNAECIILSSELNIIYSNDEQKIPLGNPEKLFSDKYWETCKKQIENAIEQKQEVVFETLENFSSKDLEVQILKTYVTPEFNAQGKVKWISLMRSDISDKWMNHEKLKLKSEFLSVVSTENRVGFFEWDLKDTIIWDQVTEEIFGYGPNEFSGSYADYLTLLHPDDREYVNTTNKKIEDVDDTEDIYEGTHKIIRANDKAERRVYFKSRILEGPEGKPIKLQGICWDITDEDQE
ncbi:chemotaxis protein CheB [Persicobacter psychrovividus]|uniref:Protein-glutamate O-methyltransferase n=1 Tax=Persicobacter psychrovividus TaxID=387638 RepID=A0ABN6L7I1_9BACT|nr:hypothetical protein PEPS_14430 [Persicobacter psychrovividus]